MRILLLTGSINQGGAEFQLLALADLLQRNGHNVQVLALTNHTYFLPYIAEKKLDYSFVSNEGSNYSKVIRSIKAISKVKPDLVISYIRVTSKVAILARVYSVFKFKLIIAERTSLIQPGSDLFYFNLALLANKVTVNSISKYEYIKKKFPLLKPRTLFIPNIINIEKYLELVHFKNEDRYVRISYIGRISPEKNILNLIKAIGIVINKGFKLTLSLIGAPSNKSYLQEVLYLIENLKLQGIVTYMGPTEDVTNIYRKTDLICLVSFYEGFSNVISEAISCGIPVIASNIDENRFLIEDGANGFLINPADEKDIAKGMEKYMQLSQKAIDQISKNNREKAIAIFDETNIYNTYKLMFKEIGFNG